MATIEKESGAEREMPVCSKIGPYPFRVVLLRNFLGPYELPWLQALRHRVTELSIVASRDTHNLLPWAMEYGGLKVEVQDRFALLEKQAHPGGFTDGTKIQLPYGTLKHLRRLRPDVIISSELGARTLQALSYTYWKKGTALVAYAAVSERTETGRGIARRLIRRLLLKRVSAVITPGSSGARYLERLGARSESIFVVPRTTDMRPFLNLPLHRGGNGALRLFFPGQQIQRKGLLPFLDALCQWAGNHPDRHVEFWLLGNGPERAALDTRPKPPNLTVTFFDGVPYDELPRFYREAGILAFPTLADEWGLVVNEALASGMPVLGSVHSQAVTELVKDGENGWTFSAGSSEETYNSIDRALTTCSERLMTMRTAARRSVELLTPEFAADRVLQAVQFAFGVGADGNNGSVRIVKED
jgi:glycosyltransferase involved in cell wall biosynthesis